MENIDLEKKTFFSFKLSSKFLFYDNSYNNFDLLKCSSFSVYIYKSKYYRISFFFLIFLINFYYVFDNSETKNHYNSIRIHKSKKKKKKKKKLDISYKKVINKIYN